MNIKLREYTSKDATAACEIWNQVVDDGIAFPQEDDLTVESGDKFFKEQTYTGIAENVDTGEAVGLYILHPNNVGRCQSFVLNCVPKFLFFFCICCSQCLLCKSGNFITVSAITETVCKVADCLSTVCTTL